MMKGDTLLDYAEFQLSPKRTRCELFVSAEGSTEKLATGFLKPFLAHLRAAEIQVARGNQVIRLEGSSTSNWLTKGTMERFVRFVSTPEVIERVKTIEDELAQLEQVRSALANTFGQIEDKFSNNYSNGVQDGWDRQSAALREPSVGTDENGADASKRELLRAMDARLNALHQEQSLAFSRARAAGFDSNNMTDLMTFAENFGADRLNDACKRFLALSRKKSMSKGMHKDSLNGSSSDSRGPLTWSGQMKTIKSNANGQVEDHRSSTQLSEKATSSLQTVINGSMMDTQRRRSATTETVQSNHSNGIQAEEGIHTTIPVVESTSGLQQTHPIQSNSSQKPVLKHNSEDQRSETVSMGNRFLVNLQQMAQQVEARSNEAFGWATHSTSPEANNSEAEWHENTCRPDHGNQVGEDQGHNEKESAPTSSKLIERSSSVPARRIHTDGGHTWNTDSRTGQHESGSFSHDDDKHGKRVLKKTEEVCTNDAESVKGTQSQEEAPIRRLSVQAAISLFESKKNDSNESPVKKKQEVRRMSVESGNSPSEKSVLRRWSSMNQPSSGESSVQEKRNVLSNGEIESKSESEAAVKDNVGAIKDSSAMSNPQLVISDQSRKSAESTEVNPLVELRRSLETSEVKPLVHSRGSLEVSEVNPVQLRTTSQHPSGRNHVSTVSEAQVQSVQPSTTDAKLADREDTIIASAPNIDAANASIMTSIKSSKYVDLDQKAQVTPVVNNAPQDPKQNNGQEDKVNWNGQVTAEDLNPALETSVPLKVKTASRGANKQPEKIDQRVAIKQENYPVKESQTIEFKGTSGINSPSVNAASRRKSSQKELNSIPNNMWSTPVDLHMQALVKMVENQHRVSASAGGEPSISGRFYEHYSKLREAKLRHENPTKRAEKEAKLKSMQETFERRKAEMEERTSRLTRKSSRKLQAQPKLVQKASYSSAQVEQKEAKDDEDGTDQEDYSARYLREYSNPSSPASTPHSTKNQVASMKSRAPKKAVPTLSKPSTTQRSSVRNAGALSPNMASKNPLGTPSQGKTGMPSSGATDNSSIKATPNSTDWRKETPRPSITRATASAKVHPKLDSQVQTAMETADDDSNLLTNDDKEMDDSRNQASITKNILAPISVLKNSSTDAGLGSPLGQQHGTTDVAVESKGRQNASQELKPFLRKGHGIGPGAGPGIMKQKASISTEVSKSSENDMPSDLKLNEETEDSEDLRMVANKSTEPSDTNDSDLGLVEDMSVSSAQPSMHIANMDGSDKEQFTHSVGGSVYLPDNTLEHSDVVQPTFFPDDLSEGNFQDTLSVDAVPSPQGSYLQVPSHKKKVSMSASLSQLLAQKNAEAFQSNATTLVASSMSFREGCLPHGQAMNPFDNSSASQGNPILQRGAVSGYFSPPASIVLDSPMGSPALWNSSQAKYPESELIHSARQMVGSTKHGSMLSQPLKEPSKGFKRLLQFGRKVRTSETATADCVSVSTTSEGDDDTEEIREVGGLSSEDLLRRGRMQRRGFEYGNAGESHSINDQGASHMLGSSIPPPPANYKPREDYLSGGNLLKAPRSFFSLSSFRSKGSEGKSR